MSNVIMLRETFSTYGLNKHRNFLAGGYVELYDKEELADWMSEQIEMHECPASAIFAIDLNLKMYVGLTNLKEESIDVICFDEWDMDLFSEIDSAERLCCYGLIEEISPGIWKILEE